MSKETMTTQYIIVDIVNKKFFLDVNGNVLIFNTYDSAVFHCGIYELPNAWVCHLMYNHIENEEQ
jgi:hypothetical protein